MELNTIDDVTKAFPDEESAKKYLAELRWGKFAKCPYCGNDKSYFADKGRRWKCAFGGCRKTYSVMIKTVFECTKLPLDKWMIAMFLYAKKRGRVPSNELEDTVGIPQKTCFLVSERIEFVFNHIDRVGLTTEQVMQKIWEYAIYYYGAYTELKHSDYYKNPYHVKDIDDISDHKQYNTLLRYTKYYVNVFCYWIDNKSFADPVEILTDVFLYMRDENVKEYNSESILKYIWQSVNRLWYQYIKDHPNKAIKINARHKDNKRNARINLTDGYISQVVKATKEHKNTPIKEIRANKKLIQETKERLISKRKTQNKISDFNSHFD
jgi:hypothetical protein